MRASSKYLIAVVILVALLIAGGLVGVKLQRDYALRDAIEQLRLMGFGGKITASEGRGTLLQFSAPARTFSNTEMDRVVASLKVIGSDRNIELVDFTNARIDEQKLLNVQTLLPNSDVRH